jgi:hypothetical protein
MHEQGKVNMIILEELQKIREAQTNGSTSEAPKLPTKPVPNPSGDCKSVHVLRSGKSYAGPTNPEVVPTTSDPAQPPVISEAEIEVCDPLGVVCDPLTVAQRPDRAVNDQSTVAEAVLNESQTVVDDSQTVPQTEKSTPNSEDNLHVLGKEKPKPVKV